MKSGLALVAAGLGVLVVQGGVAGLLPRGACPDIALLFVLALGVHAPHTTWALLVAALLGYGADLLSGSLLGQHALLRLVAVVAAMLASRRLNLRGFVPWSGFAAAATFVYGAGLRFTTDLFGIPQPPGFGWLGALALHALWTGLFASLASALVEWTLRKAGDEERRSLELGAPGRTA